MGEAANRSGSLFALGKHTHFITDTTVAQMRYPQAAIHPARIRQRLEKPAL